MNLVSIPPLFTPTGMARKAESIVELKTDTAASAHRVRTHCAPN